MIPVIEFESIIFGLLEKIKNQKIYSILSRGGGGSKQPPGCLSCKPEKQYLDRLRGL